MKQEPKYYRIVELDFGGLPIRELEICECDIAEYESELPEGHTIERFEVEQ